MKSRTVMWFMLVSSVVLLLASSCSESVAYRPAGPGIGHGPPAHAPAHGYRRNKQVAGVELVFNPGMGVYVVVGHTDHYYHEGYFYRCVGGQWEISLKPDTGWGFVAVESVPPGLKKGKVRPAQVSWSPNKKASRGKMK